MKKIINKIPLAFLLIQLIPYVYIIFNLAYTAVFKCSIEFDLLSFYSASVMKFISVIAIIFSLLCFCINKSKKMKIKYFFYALVHYVMAFHLWTWFNALVFVLTSNDGFVIDHILK